MSATRTIPLDWAKDHWIKFESDAEHAERVERCEEEAGRYFTWATEPQRAAYDGAMAALGGLTGPAYERGRDAAKQAWRRSTAEAADLFVITCDELMRSGEVSEALGAEWDALKARRHPARARRSVPLTELIGSAAAMITAVGAWVAWYVVLCPPAGLS
jgi:hypothetical protein